MSRVTCAVVVQLATHAVGQLAAPPPWGMMVSRLPPLADWFSRTTESTGAHGQPPLPLVVGDVVEVVVVVEVVDADDDVDVFFVVA